jgi:hypothetical protein
MIVRFGRIAMKTALTVLVVALFLTPSLVRPALAQDGGGGEEEFDLAAALKKVSELLAKAEGSLVESIKPGGSGTDPKKAVGEAKKALDELLDDTGQSGREAIEMMNEILKKAPRSGSGGGGDQKPQDAGESEKEKQDAREKPTTDQLDPMNSANKPENPQENAARPKGERDKPPPSKTGDPAKPDPDSWIAGLPPELRGLFSNMKLEEIPKPFQEMIRKYRDRLAEIESDRDGR